MPKTIEKRIEDAMINAALWRRPDSSVTILAKALDKAIVRIKGLEESVARLEKRETLHRRTKVGPP